MVMMKVIGMLLHGDEDEEREPSWYTDDPYDAPSAYDPVDDDLDLMDPPEVRGGTNPFQKDLTTSPDDSTSSDTEYQGYGRHNSLRHTRVRRRKMKIVSAGRLRKNRQAAQA